MDPCKIVQMNATMKEIGDSYVYTGSLFTQTQMALSVILVWIGIMISKLIGLSLGIGANQILLDYDFNYTQITINSPEEPIYSDSRCYANYINLISVDNQGLKKIRPMQWSFDYDEENERCKVGPSLPTENQRAPSSQTYKQGVPSYSN